MKLRLRPATASDLKAYVRYFTIRERYGDLFGRLAEVWCGLLRRESIVAAVVEDLDRDQEDCLVGIRVSAFLSDSFARHGRTPPLFWIGPELIRRIDQNGSPILDFSGLREANSGGGLNLFVWEIDIRPLEEPEFLAVFAALSRALFEFHAGFNIKEVMAQHPRGRVLRAAIRSGDWLVHQRSGDYVVPRDVDAIERANSPYVCGLTRELAHKLPGSSLGNLFCYTPPRVFFTPAEQRLLTAAASGRTDEEIAAVLVVSLSGVKRCWESVYARASFRLPGLFSEDRLSLSGARGAEKRRRLLCYLREHREELRPCLPPSTRDQERDVVRHSQARRRAAIGL